MPPWPQEPHGLMTGALGLWCISSHFLETSPDVCVWAHAHTHNPPMVSPPLCSSSNAPFHTWKLCTCHFVCLEGPSPSTSQCWLFHCLGCSSKAVKEAIPDPPSESCPHLISSAHATPQWCVRVPYQNYNFHACLQSLSPTKMKASLGWGP